MDGFETLNLKTKANSIDEDYLTITGLDPKMNIDDILDSKIVESKTILHEKLEDYLILLDEGIKVVIKMHEICKSNNLKKKSGFAFVVLTAKFISLFIGIRKMIYSGLVDCIKNLNRPLIETIDIFYACLNNKELSDAFARTHEMYDNNKFYWDKFSKDKLSKEYISLFNKLSLDKDYIEFLNSRRKSLRSFLSESIHSSFNATFSNYTMCTLDLEFSDNYYGKVTTAYPRILMTLIEEIYILTSVFSLTLEHKIAKDFVNMNVEDIDPLFLHYNNKFADLYRNNWKHLSEQSELYTIFFTEVMNLMKEDSNGTKDQKIV